MADAWAPFGTLVETRLRVATWNLWGRYGPWEERGPVVLENLRAVDADVVCLQEAWRDGARSQPRELASALGMHGVYEPAFEINGAWSGNAVLSRWPVLRHDTFPPLLDQLRREFQQFGVLHKWHRLTHDVDLVIYLRTDDVPPLSEMFPSPELYIEEPRCICSPCQSF